MSDTSSVHGAHDHVLPPPPPAPPTSTQQNATKRKSDQAGISGNGTRPQKSVKRRASKACQCCRARKVRCNVVEQIPCTNCRLDEVECIVSESKRKKYETTAVRKKHCLGRVTDTVVVGNGPNLARKSLRLMLPSLTRPTVL